MGLGQKSSRDLGGGNSNMFFFHPGSLGKCSNLTVAYFSNGLVQPPGSDVCSILFFFSGGCLPHKIHGTGVIYLSWDHDVFDSLKLTTKAPENQ